MQVDIPTSNAQTQLYVLGLERLRRRALRRAFSSPATTSEGGPWTVWRSSSSTPWRNGAASGSPERPQMSIALLPTLFAAVLFGPLAAGIVNASSMLGDPELLVAV